MFATPTDSPAAAAPADRLALPADDPQRESLHNEVHARPTARIRVPALVVYVAVLNAGVSREHEAVHLRRLSGQGQLDAADLAGNFLRLRLPGATLKWERHAEFTRYTLVQTLPSPAPDGVEVSELEPMAGLAVDTEWLRGIPGRTIAAANLVMINGSVDVASRPLAQAQPWFGERTVVASLMGQGHSLAVTDFRLRHTGFERMVVIAPPGTSDTRAGRIAARLLEVETYRMMALRGLPVAKSLQPMLAETETALADITAAMERHERSDQELLDALAAQAARVERATAQHGYRFSATTAYHELVRARIAELREAPLPGTQTIGEFMQRRLAPAIATVTSTAERLTSLSQRIERAGALLRTRVDIARETQNQQLLAKLTRGQELQLRLQSTVEGLSIAAISYYVVSLVLYAAKALQKMGLPLHPELTAGLSIPLVLWGVWKLTRRVHERLRLHG
jgi:uncharacterized membrane-anchored protein